ncbi:hypothetical protein KNSL1_013682 [Colletotrichum chrysophilum]|nr:hypothetical protein Brms1b_013262 [Colletotrichum noveboracense]KAJ0334946.1 hypothetical protein KNSL1_013682 [Colletotrichum chrysophilum]
MAHAEAQQQSINNKTASQEAVDRILQLRQIQADRVKTSNNEIIRVTSEKLEPNPWLHRVGWAEHLRGLDANTLFKTTEAIREEETTLQRMWETVSTVLDQSRAASGPNTVGHAVLFEAQRSEAHVKPRRPFDNRMEEDTWTRYKDVWRVLLCIWFRTQEMTDEERPPYKLTTQQEDTWDRFEQLAEAADTDAARIPQQEREQAGLRMLMAMLDHQLKASHYDNALISALAVMGISEDGGWVDIRDYTGKYSAVVKVARMLVIQQACSERRDEVARLAEDIGQDAAEDGATSLFQHVRRKVRRFMTRTSGDKDAEPTPMDWILETRTYGMHIQFNTASAGVIDWVGDRVSYRRVQFTMGQLSDALHELVREARGLLAELTMTDGPDGTEVEPTGRLPDIPWASISDDHSETKAGYSFISDDRNEWVRKADGWLFHRIAGSAAMRRRWGLESSGEDGPAFQPGATREYKHTFEQFRERLWMLLHTLGGQPGRATEMGGLRMVNTANGGVRNVFIHDKMACFVTAYHKGYRATSSAKVIHRYLPREVGELLVWYLWLVLPFWQEVEGITTGSGRYSAFLWADETVQQASGTASAARDADAESMTGNSNAGEGAGPADEEDVGAWSWKEERTWTTDRARRIMQRTSARLLGNQVNVSMWRHIAIGIANRYLNEAFGREREDGRAGGNGDDEDDELGDSAWDLQAGHSTRLAGMIYARELMQFGSGLAAKRQQFRQVSRQWHRFLGFGAEDRGTAGGGVGTKRKAEAYDGPRLEARLRRFERLRRADFTGQLRQMTGDESSEFRGNQRQAVLAIANGHSPVVQVMGTGGGKSVSFMLPAFCSPDGVTVVITPLVALRTDMHMRCVRAGITSHVWQSRKNNQAASIVFVTPESAITKGFRDFIAQLQGRQALDRVVVDECRRVVLDRVMDGRTDRFGCEDGEELCDVCRGWSLGDKERDDDEKGSRGNDTAGQAAFHRQERQMQVGRWQVSQEMMRESEEVDSFLRRIYQQCGKCLLCSGEEEDGHEFEQCPRREADEWRQIQERVQLVEREMFSKKRFERFSGCFNCGLPQDVCARWEAEAEDGGRFRRLKGAICQFSRTLVGLFSASIARLPEAQWSGVTEEAMEAEGVSFREQEDEGQSRFYQWLGGRIQWGGLESSRLCQLTYLLQCELDKEQEWVF